MGWRGQDKRDFAKGAGQQTSRSAARAFRFRDGVVLRVVGCGALWVMKVRSISDP
jgi:hypothetical protein